jgi:histidine triad (HIT) family protein
MSSIFTQIINGTIPCYKIDENEHFLAFLDIFPIKEGHVLIVSKEEVDKFFDLNDELLREWLLFAKPIAKALEQSFPCNRCGMSVIGLEVPHAHMHLMPINSIDDINFSKPKLKLDDHQFKAIQNKIISHLS